MLKYALQDSSILIPGLFPTIIPYENITQIRKSLVWLVWFDALNIFRPPLIALPLDFSFHAVVIETKNKRLIALTLRNCDDFIKAVRERMGVYNTRTM
jgi:hypothetical protein